MSALTGVSRQQHADHYRQLRARHLADVLGFDPVTAWLFAKNYGLLTDIRPAGAR